MPKQKDLKRLARTRMEKTGESYTAARSQLLAKKARAAEAQAPAEPTAQPPAQPPVEPPDYAALAGIRDQAVEAKTGRGWERWVRTLDHEGAASWPHRQIAAYVHEQYGIPGWWAQTVTVGYERIKGLREVGQRRSGSYETSKSKTIPVPLAELYRAFADGRRRKRWLGDVELTVRTATPERSMRITWDDGTSVEVGFYAKGESKSQVALQHSKLASKADVQARKAFWGERLEALAALLTG
jgi:hypothetical protein